MEVVNFVRLASNQLRLVPLRIIQDAPLPANVDRIPVELWFNTQGREGHFTVNVPIRHRSFPDKGLIATYMYAESMPTAFAANSPTGPSEGGSERPAILALRKSRPHLLKCGRAYHD